MLVFEKKERICDARTLGLHWCSKNLMVPTPYLVSPSTIRLFLTMCDEKNIGRIGFVDVRADNPSEIVAVSERPLLDVGGPGTYDDNGVVTSSLYADGKQLYLFFSGYELSVKIPYKIFCGVAVSKDNGNTFVRVNKASLLPPIDEELYNRCQPYLLKLENGFRVFYLGDAGNVWRPDKKGHLVPKYNMLSIEATDIVRWPSVPGREVMPFMDDEETGMTVPTIWREDGIYKMIFSLRRVNAGYKISYSESTDGVRFVRHDEQLKFIGRQSDWDSEMMCFARLITVGARTYMFYSGNHYGVGGIGWAELVK